MAQIRKRGNRWHARIHSLDLNCSFPSKADAEAWARMMEAGPLPDLDTTTLAQLIEECIADGEVERQFGLERILKSELGARTLSELTTEAIGEFLDAEEELRRSGAVWQDYRALERIFDTARRKLGYPLKQNPMRGVPKPGPVRRRYRPPSDRRIEELVAAADPEMAALLRLASRTGLRLDELLAIERGDIDLEQSVLHVSKPSLGPSRQVPLDPQGEAALRHQLLDGREVVFSLSRQEVKARFRSLAHGEIYFQDLRDRAIERFFERGYETEEIARMTGHSNTRRLAAFRPWPVDRVGRRSPG